MDYKKLMGILPKNVKLKRPKSAQEWRELEQATLEVLKKVKREKELERLSKQG